MLETSRTQDQLMIAARQKVKERKYWLNQLSGEPGKTSIYTDKKRTEDTVSIDVVTFQLRGEVFERLIRLSGGADKPLHVILLSALFLLIKRYTGKQDIIIGTTIYRQDRDRHFQFTNTILPIRNRLDGADTFKDLLLQTRQTVIEAVEHQSYPMEVLVKELNLSPSETHFPLFDAALLLENIQDKNYLKGIKIGFLFSFLSTGSGIEGRLEFDALLYEREAVQRITAHFSRLLQSALENPGSPLASLEMLSDREKKQLLRDFNDTYTDYPGDKTIGQLFAEQVKKTPDNTALVFADKKLTYKALNEKANRLARVLRHKGIEADTIMGLMMERSIEMITAIFGILKAGGAYLPIDSGMPEKRILSMMNDCGVSILLTQTDVIHKPGFTLLQDFQSIRSTPLFTTSTREILLFDELEDRLAAESVHNLEPINQSVNLAYTIFTSGSTGKPKGALTTHGNVIRVMKDTNYIDIAADDRVLQLSNYAFDGSVFDIYAALLNGSSLVILKEDEVFSLDRLANVIKREGITIFFVTTALFNLLVEMELECFKDVRKVLFGGERISVDHAKRALAYMGKDRIIHVYGPTETTVYAAFYFINEIPGTAATIPIGAPISNTTLYILDKYLQLLPIGIPGEIYIGGSGTARGYMNCQELTAEKFILAHSSWLIADRKEKKASSSGEFPMSDVLSAMSCLYKTGDLARWLPDGNIEFLGRMDQQVKIRGFRVEPGEIENHLLNHKDIKKAVVVVREKENQEKYLCAYVVVRKEITSSQLREFLSRDLSEYMIPSHFIQLEAIPLTVNGKVDRKALPVPEMERVGTYTPPGNEVERKVVEIWSEILGIEREIIDIKANFFHLGGHSLKATELCSHLHKQLGVKIPLVEIFRNPSVQEMAAFIKRAEEEKYTAIESMEKKEYCPMSSAQKRLYFLQEMDMENIAYNMPYVLRLAEDIQIHRLEQAFKRLISRHESLRTSFHMLGEEPVQRIHDNVEFQIGYYDLAVEESHHSSFIIHHFIRPFDLAKAPLLRVGYTYTKTPDNQTLLLIDMHHIITDGTSQEILEKEFKALYKGEELHPLKLQYKDFAQWQNSSKQQAFIKRQERYWLDLFPGEIPVLNLPTDYKRPLIQSFEGAAVKFSLTPEISGALKQVTGSTDTTFFMVILALFNILLARLSGQEDIIVGAPVAARRHADLEGIIGMFVNTLALRNYPRGEKTFKIFLQELKTKTLAAYENQEYPFEDLVETVSVSRDIGRNPIFDVMFNFLNQSEYKYAAEPSKVGEKEEAVYRHRDTAAKFDMNLAAVNQGETIYCELDYCTKLFNASTIERFIGYFKRIAGAAAENINVKISEIDMMDKSEKALLLDAFNQTLAAYPCEKSVCQLFEEQAARIPDSVSLIYGDMQITFEELKRRVNQLARYLDHQGVKRGSGSIAAIQSERSIELIIGIFAILKTGAAYLPIESQCPPKRRGYILKDSRTPVLLSQETFIAGSVPGRGTVDVHYINIEDPMLYQGDDTGLEGVESLSLRDLIYVIYTSGSTGMPKGVLVEHKGVINLLYFMQSLYPIDRYGAYLLKTNYVFDVSVTEVFGWVLGGGKLVILEPGMEKEPLRILEVMERYAITHINFVPSMLNMFFECIDESSSSGSKLKRLRYILTAGEAFSKTLLKKSKLLPSWIRVENIYGPTEASVYTTAYCCDPGSRLEFVPIGKPLPNVRSYILDKWNRLVPRGVVGELCIGGEGVVRGYLNNPELTNEKFLSISYKSYRSYRSYFSKKLYKTGDLARWLPDGNIEFLGRMDQQVKLRGFRIEPGEIENRLLMHQDIKEAVVVIRQDKRRERYLCAYLVVRRAGEEISIPGLREYLSTHLPEYMIPSHFVQIGTIPLTPGGKVDRRVLPGPEIRKTDNYAAPRSELERRVVDIWSEILGIEKDAISLETNFFHLGGNSLKAMELCSHLHKQLGVKIPLVEIFKNPSAQKLAVFINKAEKEKYAAIEPMEKKEYYPMSSAQKRLYVLQELEPGNTTYNIPYILPAENIHIPLLEHAFKQLISRHESLRTSFHMLGEEPVQRIHDNVEFQIGYYDLAAEESFHSSFIIHHFIRPFDLAKAPLFRAGYGRTPDNRILLLIDMHHTITDGTAQEILAKEFKVFYKGEELHPLKLQYKDFAEWQNSSKQQQLIKQQEHYWLDLFPGEIPVLNLPNDFKRPLIQSFEGAAVGFALDPEISGGLKQVTGSTDTTFFMVILALFNILLARLSGQEDIIVGAPVAARRHADLEGIIGMFVNTLALRNYPRGEKTFKIFLQELKTGTLAAYENQEYPFEDLVETVSVSRDIGRNPIFDVMFNFLNQSEYKYAAEPSKVGEKEEAVYRHRDTAAKFDMNLAAVNQGETIYCELEYCTKLFNASTIERFIGYFKHIARAAAENINVKISEIDMMDKSEKALLLDAFNQTLAAYPCEKTVCQLFEEQAARMPDSVSLIYGDMQITFEELKRRVNQLACYLNHQGLKRGSGSIAAIQSERSIELIIGIFAILKAGAAYLPIEPQCPPKRRDYILKDSRTPVLLAQETLIVNAEPDCGVKDVSYINLENPLLYRRDDIDFEGIQSLQDLIYVIYTSGSTGVPKGVLVEHKGVINLLYFMQSLYPMDTYGAYLLKTNYIFDVSVTEVFGWVLGGGKLVILGPGMEKEPSGILEVVERYGITHINFVPSMLNMLFECIDETSESKLKRLRYILTAGEAFSKTLLKKSGFLSSRIRVENIYGPTEASVYTTAYCCDPGSRLEFVPIGKPLPNVKTYILDKWNRLVPWGVAGELYIGGDGVGRGYLNNPELTAEKFFSVSYRSHRSYRSYISFKKIYKTGDLARWLPDGNIEFLGRIDHQVKLRGFRIELEEIESKLNNHENIHESVVVIKSHKSGDKYLCAYVVFKKETPVSELREFMSKELPGYMIPSYFRPMDHIPLTPSGKVDRKRLPDPGAAHGLVHEKYEPPTNETEKRLVEIWQQVLKLEKIGIHDDFFKIGGDSLKAVQLVSQMIKDFDVSVNDIFVYRTAAALMKNIVMKKDNIKKKIEEFRKRLLLPGNKVAANPVQEKIMKTLNNYRRQVNQTPLKGLNAKNKYRKILLTGATGFLGAQLAAELLKITRAELYLLVRRKSGEDCTRRLERKLTYYFGRDFYHAHKERLQVVPGDLTGDRAGINDIRYESLSGTIDAVVHAAANVKHFGHPADFYQTNVLGTEKLLQFSMTGKQKDFHYISTLSVCSGNVEGKEYMVYTEFSEDMGQQHENAYVESKFETEKKIYAARKQGLNASIYRLGNLVFHSQTGIFQENIADNAFYANIKAFITLGAAAEDLRLSDFTFVDHAARAIVLLMMRKNLLNRNHHILNHHTFEWRKMEQALENTGIKIQFLRPTLFFDYLLEQLEERSQRRNIERLLLHLGLFEKERKNRTIHSVAAHRTLKVLKKLDFQWPEITNGHIEKMITHCQKVGFLEQ